MAISTINQNSIATGLGLVPSGAVMNFAMSTAPTGWLAADGSAVSRTTYASLFAAIGTTFGSGNGSTTFNLPNLGGQFTRNWISGQSTDSGRTFGSSQTDAFQGHVHSYRAPASAGPSTIDNLPNPPQGNYSTVTSTSTPITDGTNGTPRTASETRPTNVALLACIKT